MGVSGTGPVLAQPAVGSAAGGVRHCMHMQVGAHQPAAHLLCGHQAGRNRAHRLAHTSTPSSPAHARSTPTNRRARGARPPVNTSSTCPASVICSGLPSCGFAGQVVDLAGTCTAGGGAANVTYLVNGVPTTTATCPALNAAVNIAVVAIYTKGPLAGVVLAPSVTLQLQGEAKGEAGQALCVSGEQAGGAHPTGRQALVI